jgi:hypothetical protein
MQENTPLLSFNDHPGLWKFFKLESLTRFKLEMDNGQYFTINIINKPTWYRKIIRLEFLLQPVQLNHIG